MNWYFISFLSSVVEYLTFFISNLNNYVNNIDSNNILYCWSEFVWFKTSEIAIFAM